MGAGHDGAANEICERLNGLGFSTKVVDFLDACKPVGWILYSTYHFQMEHSPGSYELMYGAWKRFKILSKLTTAALGFFFERGLRKWAKEFHSDAIVSTYPFASVVLGRARAKKSRPLTIPTFTFLTDFAVHPLWVHSGVDTHICVSPSAEEGVLAIDPRAATAVSGPFVSKKFFTHRSRASLRAEFGIPSDSKAVLISAGSWGVGEIERTFTLLADEPGVFPVIVCGKNEPLRQSLSSVGRGLVIGWSNRMPDLMSCCDIVIQNAGGLTALEAFASGVPVISYMPIAGHGKDNTDRMEASGVTLYAKSEEELTTAVRETSWDAEATFNALSLFQPNPEIHIVEALEDAENDPRGLPSMGTRTFLTAARVAVVAFILLVGANLTANVVGNGGINVDRVAARLPYVYVAIRPGANNIDSTRLLNEVRSNSVGAVMDLAMVTLYPSAVTAWANSGATIVNGGNSTDSDLHLFLPQNNAGTTYEALSGLVGPTAPVYLPSAQINSVDIAWADLHHIVIPRKLLYTANMVLPKKLNKATVIEIDATNLTSAQALGELHTLIGDLRHRGLTIATVSTLD